MNSENQGKYFWIEAKGKSMVPFIKEGDCLLIEKSPLARIKLGDIIAIKNEKGVILHRFIRKYQRDGKFYFQEKGDRNLKGREVLAEAILGRAVFIKSKHKEKNLNRLGWKILNIALALSGHFLFFFYRLFKKIKEFFLC